MSSIRLRPGRTLQSQCPPCRLHKARRTHRHWNTRRCPPSASTAYPRLRLRSTRFLRCRCRCSPCEDCSDTRTDGCCCRSYHRYNQHRRSTRLQRCRCHCSPVGCCCRRIDDCCYRTSHHCTRRCRSMRCRRCRFRCSLYSLLRMCIGGSTYRSSCGRRSHSPRCCNRRPSECTLRRTA